MSNNVELAQKLFQKLNSPTALLEVILLIGCGEYGNVKPFNVSFAKRNPGWEREVLSL